MGAMTTPGDSTPSAAPPPTSKVAPSENALKASRFRSLNRKHKIAIAATACVVVVGVVLAVVLTLKKDDDDASASGGRNYQTPSSITLIPAEDSSSSSGMLSGFSTMLSGF